MKGLKRARKYEEMSTYFFELVLYQWMILHKKINTPIARMWHLPVNYTALATKNVLGKRNALLLQVVFRHTFPWS